MLARSLGSIFEGAPDETVTLGEAGRFAAIVLVVEGELVSLLAVRETDNVPYKR